MRGAAIAAVLVALVATMSLTSVPAASADNPLCPANTFCLFKNSNYSGGRYVFTVTTNRFSNLRWDNGSGSVDDTSSSAINNLNYTAVLYETSYVPCLGRQLSIPPHSEVLDFSKVVLPPDNTNRNDMFSCIYWY